MLLDDSIYDQLNGWNFHACSVCGGRGSIFVAGKQTPCQECPAGERYAKNLALEYVSRVNSPVLFKKAKLTDFDEMRGKQNAVALCREILDGNRKTVVLVGAYGTGKTHMMCAALHEIAGKGILSRYTRVSAMIDTINAAYGNPELIGEDEKRKYMLLPALGLDEMGLSKVSEATLRVVEDVIRERMDEGRITIITTNYTQAQVQTVWGERITSRLRAAAWVEVGGTVMRKQLGVMPSD